MSPDFSIIQPHEEAAQFVEDMVDDERAKDEERNPEDQNVIEGPALEQLEVGTLLRNGQRFDVSPPSEGPEGQDAFQWNPDDLRIPIEQLRDRYEPEVFGEFEAWSKNMKVGGSSLWDYLEPRRKPKGQK